MKDNANGDNLAIVSECEEYGVEFLEVIPAEFAWLPPLEQLPEACPEGE